MKPLRYLPNYTVSDYKLWEGDWELIDGIPNAMSPSPLKKHQLLAIAVLNHISAAMEKSKNFCSDGVVVYELDWIINDSTVLHPDIALTCDKEGDFITSPPVLIVEILSPSTAYKDRIVKAEIYCEQGVKYYLLADPDAKTFQIFILKDGKYVESNSNTNFSIQNDCSIQFSLEDALKKFAD
jgi:Uma2 family endonuclease